ncbi:MAG: hypothetical protein ACO4CU_09125, partial [Ilumatobacteraceae bacterium]
KVLRASWMQPGPDGATSRIDVPQPITVALGICVAGTVVLGVVPSLVLRFADLADLTDNGLLSAIGG